MNKLKVGDEFEMVFPFHKYKLFYNSDPNFIWQPGCEVSEEDDGGSSLTRWFTAHGEGKVIYKILSLAKMPDRYLDRVIFRRWLIDPDGKKYNNGEVRTLTKNVFHKHITSRTPFPVDYEVE